MKHIGGQMARLSRLLHLVSTTLVVLTFTIVTSTSRVTNSRWSSPDLVDTVSRLRLLASSLSISIQIRLG